MFLFGRPHQVCFPLKFELILSFLIELIWAFLLLLTSLLHFALVPVLAYSLMFHNCVYFCLIYYTATKLKGTIHSSITMYNLV